MGSHDFKFGGEWQDDQSEFGNNGASGQILYRDLNGALDLVRLTDLAAGADFGAGWRSDLRALGQSEGVFDVHT